MNATDTNVFDVVEYNGFDFGCYYDGEQEIIKPQLEAKGFTKVKFFNIEADSFGPLIRGVNAVNSDGNLVTFWYG